MMKCRLRHSHRNTFYSSAISRPFAEIRTRTNNCRSPHIKIKLKNSRRNKNRAIEIRADDYYPAIIRRQWRKTRDIRV